MHELGIALSIYKICRATMRAHGSGRRERVKVTVGEFWSVEPELLRFAWDAVTGETSDSGASLEIQWEPAHQFCSSCGREKQRSDGSWLRVCPDCGDILEIRGGQQLDVLELSFGQPDSRQEVEIDGKS